MRILAIETSCDDTGIAILEYDRKSEPRILADLVSSQTKIHAPWGGVVPMLAKREHQRNLLPLLKQALRESGLLKIYNFQFPISKQIPNPKFQMLKKILEREEALSKKLIPFLKKHQKPKIDLIGVTVGPGLEPALWVGVNFARALGYFWNLPIIPVNHIEAHIAANFFQSEKIGGKSKLSPYGRSPEGRQTTNYHPSGDHPQGGKLLLPAVCLVVSGGHTQLILMKKFGQYEIIGETRDDAAGEAFDKVAKMLKLDYPGGPAIAKIANLHKYNHKFSRIKIRDISDKFVKISDIKFPRPMLNSGNFDFSFSGLKTAVLYFVKTLSPAQLKKLMPAIAAEFQQAVIDVLAAKTLAAAKKYAAKTIMLSGGVAANDALRKTLKLSPYGRSPEGRQTTNYKLHFLVPPKNFCTDNAAMVALTAYKKIKNKSLSGWPNWRNVRADANLKLNYLELRNTVFRVVPRSVPRRSAIKSPQNYAEPDAELR